ncbi:hypothetical protein H0E87_005864 [Populus deltoides]|uniref:Uncharacterized protein n=1 Tax=Populus deltoides TaxID=3696 RepID=A0A8T2Z4S0_POPDE|nr:hypothetical protein H0E87_005864 [Populus deltoides]
MVLEQLHLKSWKIEESYGSCKFTGSSTTTPNSTGGFTPSVAPGPVSPQGGSGTTNLQPSGNGMPSVYARIHKLACQCHGNSTASYLETSAGSGGVVEANPCMAIVIPVIGDDDSGVTVLGTVPSTVKAWKSTSCMEGLEWTKLE